VTASPRAGDRAGAPARRSNVAIFALYVVMGLAMATWVTQTPAVRDALAVSIAQMGNVILMLAGGSVVGLLGAGRFVDTFGARAAVILGLALVAAGLGGTALFTAWGSLAAVMAGLFVFGFGNGLTDVGLNVEGAVAERDAGRSLMPVLHAGYSAGNLLGAGIGAAAATLGVSAPVHLTAVAVLASGGLAVARGCLPRPALEPHGSTKPGAAVSIWRDWRLLCLAVLIAGAALAEGAGHDWIPLLMVDGYATDQAVAAATYGAFVTAMLVVRLLGGRLVDRFGRAAVLGVSGLCGAAGLLLVIPGIGTAVAVAGVLLWGIGVALGFPLVMSAAGEAEHGAATRVGFVAVVGYAGLLAGPPLLGHLSHAVGIRHAMVVALVALLVAAMAAPAARSTRRQPRPYQRAMSGESGQPE